jgi:hypothetical protein
MKGQKLICKDCNDGTNQRGEVCLRCGKRTKLIAYCQYRSAGGFPCNGGRSFLKNIVDKVAGVKFALCSNCSKMCARCKKHFCVGHIKKHRCK